MVRTRVDVKMTLKLCPHSNTMTNIPEDGWCIRCKSGAEECGKTICKKCEEKESKIRFTTIFDKLPPESRKLLVLNWWENPVSLNVIMMEIKAGTKKGKNYLNELGFK